MFKNFIQKSMIVTSWVNWLQSLALLAMRLYLADVFFKSGLTKIQDWSNTLALFTDEYKVPVLPPAVAAVMGAGGELFFPILLVLGLAGRFGAAGLFVVNLMAVLSYPQLFEFECPAAIQSHFFWGSLIALLVVFGPGKISVDHFILKRLGLAPARPQI